MKKTAFVLVPFLLLPILFFAQRFSPRNHCSNEIGIVGGFNAYSGDLTQKFAETKELRFGFGGFFRHHFSENFSVRAQIGKGLLSGDDRHNDEQLNFRKFRFTTTFVEGTVVGEYHPLGKTSFDDYGWRIFKPYVFAGAGFTRARQTTEDYSGVNDVKNGRGFDASEKVVEFPEPGLKQNFVTLPFGVGVRANVGEQLILGVEASFRPVFSDYLDGVKLNGNETENDWYHFLGVSLSYVLQSKRHPCRMF